MPLRPAAATVLIAAVALAASGCGSGSDNDEGAPRAASAPAFRTKLKGATAVTAKDFPAVRGGTLQQVADSLDGSGPKVGLATTVFTPGRDRLAFGVIDDKSGFVYGPTAIYLADDGPDRPARGPFPAPADALITDPAFRSQTAASETDPFAAIYEATVPLPRAGDTFALAVTKINGKLVGATTSLDVASSKADRIPEVGEQAPKVKTDTVASAGGDVKSIDTRLPPDDMHGVSAAEVIGKKPVALLFATPALCQSRVCGPVVDIEAQLKDRYGDRMQFIHQEVYEDNQVDKGLRKPLKQFNLETEPWLFVMDRTGKITARLEGSFGFDAFERAIKSGL